MFLANEQVKGYNDDPIYFHFSQEGAEKGRNEGGEKCNWLLAFWCAKPWGRTLGAA